MLFFLHQILFRILRDKMFLKGIHQKYLNHGFPQPPLALFLILYVSQDYEKFCRLATWRSWLVKCLLQIIEQLMVLIIFYQEVGTMGNDGDTEISETWPQTWKVQSLMEKTDMYAKSCHHMQWCHGSLRFSLSELEEPQQRCQNLI